MKALSGDVNVKARLISFSTFTEIPVNERVKCGQRQKQIENIAGQSEEMFYLSTT